MPRWVRMALGVLLGVLIAVVGLYLYTPRNEQPTASTKLTIGGAFTLTNQDGQTVHDTDLRGQILVVFFGFSHCPDVCPTGLSTITAALNQLSKTKQEHITPLFITVDPARDTPSVLKTYLESFHPRFIGLTGTEQALKVVLDAYRVFRNATPKNNIGEYMMEHSSIIYIMGKDGKFITHLSHTDTPEVLAQTLDKLL
jgi:cytochrome oxidase Cu insertion factor (SCO1/SenC/PrrC family)